MVIPVIACLIVAAIPAGTYYSLQSQFIERIRTKELNAAIQLTKAEIENAADKAALLSANVSGTVAIADALRTRDKAKLESNLSSIFNKQAFQYDIHEGQFVVPPATSFLRLLEKNAPENEELGAFREMIVGALQRGKTLQGMEVGRRGLSIRSISPIQDAQGLVGAFEVGLGFQRILENVKRVTHFDIAVFVNENIMRTVATHVSKAESLFVVGNYRNITSTNLDLMRRIVSRGTLTDTHNEFTSVENIGGVQYSVASIPLIDFKGDNIGAILIAGNGSFYQKAMINTAIWICALFVIQSILFIAIILTLTRVGSPPIRNFKTLLF